MTQTDVSYDYLGSQAKIAEAKVAPEARVLIIMTGGTICMRRSSNGFVPARGFLESGLAPRPSFNDGSDPKSIHAMADDHNSVLLPSLRTPISTYGKHVRYVVLEFDKLLDSSSINADGWTEIAQTVYRNYTLFDAFVVLHGTDSMAYSCSALSFMLQNLGKPVILTGSQAPMLELQNDATDNLLGSLIIAGHFMIPEVCLFFNYKLFRGNRVTKISASDFTAFASPNFSPLAEITSSKTNVHWDLIYRPTRIKAFSIQTNRDIGHVACLRIFPGIRPEMVEAVLKVEALKGLVLETFGAGNAPGGSDGALTRIFGQAIQKGIIIVNVTQCASLNYDKSTTTADISRHDGHSQSPIRTSHEVETGRGMYHILQYFGSPNLRQGVFLRKTRDKGSEVLKIIIVIVSWNKRH